MNWDAAGFPNYINVHGKLKITQEDTSSMISYIWEINPLPQSVVQS